MDVITSIKGFIRSLLLHSQAHEISLHLQLRKKTTKIEKIIVKKKKEKSEFGSEEWRKAAACLLVNEGESGELRGQNISRGGESVERERESREVSTRNM